MQAETDHITTPGKAPAFQFYASDFISGTIDLPAVDVGVYIRFLCYQWEKGTVPADVAMQARIGGVSKASMAKIWARIQRHFTPYSPCAFINARLEKVRQEQLEYRRRQSDKGKASAASRKATGAQPEGNHGSTTVQPAFQPEGQPKVNPPTSFSGLQALPRKILADDGMGPDERIRDVAYELRELYPEIYAECRAGATYRTTRATESRDNPKYYAAAEMHPDIRKLRELLKVFLTRPMGDRSSPGTPGQFVNMLPECDEVLRRSGWKATA